MDPNEETKTRKDKSVKDDGQFNLELVGSWDISKVMKLK